MNIEEVDEIEASSDEEYKKYEEQIKMEND